MRLPFSGLGSDSPRPADAVEGVLCPVCGAVVPLGELQRHHRACSRGTGDIRHERRWRKLRAAIIRRDEGRCVVCGSSTDLEVHHLNGAADNSPNALVTLCAKCHDATRRPPE